MRHWYSTTERPIWEGYSNRVDLLPQPSPYFMRWLPEFDRRLRWAVIGRSLGVCENCGIFLANAFHHLRYPAEHPDDYMHVCSGCHYDRHYPRRVDPKQFELEFPRPANDNDPLDEEWARQVADYERRKRA